MFAVGHAQLTDHGRWKAATLALGRRAVLSHRSAAELWKLLPSSGGRPHVTVPYPASPEPRARIHLHRSRSLARTRIVSRDGIPVTMPARTLADLARTAPAWEVRRATRAAEKRGLPLGRDHLSDRTESDLERDFLAICRAHGIPEPECNVPIGGHRVDCLWRAEPRGLRVTRIDDSRIDEDPAGVAAAVIGLLRLRAR